MSSQAQASSDEQALARLADTEYLVRRSVTKGYQIFSILAPPIYAGVSIFRKGRGHLTVNRLLRATWLGGAAGRRCKISSVPYIPHTHSGIASGGAFEYVRSSNSSSETLRSRRIRAAYDTDALRADDHATIGALLCAVLTPAIFWKRGTAIHLIFGGAGLGTAAGYFTHVARSASGDVPPRPVVPQIVPSS
ncbi:hypothetical protein BJY52DRAFT_1112108 [Lactarius psammicola]|nr:hypothetical protein BJY52DRAFT_1112108 [Lactarius psammicola]